MKREQWQQMGSSCLWSWGPFSISTYVSASSRGYILLFKRGELGRYDTFEAASDAALNLVPELCAADMVGA